MLDWRQLGGFGLGSPRKQFRVLNASNGKVDFELDIHKDHTVGHPLCFLFLWYC